MNTEITLGKPYFQGVTMPLFVVLYLLMGIAPLSAWGAMSVRRLGRLMFAPVALTLITLVIVAVLWTRDAGALFGYGVVVFAGCVAVYETYRGAAARRKNTHEALPIAMIALFGKNRRRYGGFIVHLGITVIGIGVIGSTLFQVETQRNLNVGESLDFGGYTLRFDGLDNNQIAHDNRIMDIANLTLIRNGQVLATLRPRHDFFPQAQEMNVMNIAGAHSTLENDFYVLLAAFSEDGTTATFKVYINPLINLVWWGGLILILGTLISVAPSESVPARVRESAALKAGARA